VSKRVLLIVLILVLFISNMSFGSDVNTIGLNEFHNNNSKGSSVLPLEKKWELDIGLVYGQPLIIDNLAYVVTSRGLVVVDIDAAQVVAERKIDNANIYATPYIEKISSTKHNIYIPLNRGIEKLVATKSNNKVSLSSEWINKENILANNLSLINDFNRDISKKYIVASSKNSKLYILDSNTGNSITNGIISYTGTLGMGIPHGDYSSIIIAGDNDIFDRGYFASISVVNGVGQKDYLYNENMLFDVDVLGLSEFMSYAKFRDILTGKTTDLIFAIEKQGSIVGYDPFNDNVLFKINKYDGIGDVSGIAVVNRYLIVSYKSGKIVCIDYERAIYDAQYHPEKIVETIVFETTNKVETFSNPLIIKDSNGNNVLINANLDGNLRAYRLDRYNSNSKVPLEVENAFKFENKGMSSIKIPNGIYSNISYGNNQLLFVNGKGILYSYSGSAVNNLLITDLKNSKEGGLEKGKTYKANFTIINSTNNLLKDVVLELIVDNKHSYKNKVDVPSEGLDVELEYTVPLDFEGDVLNLMVKVNMENRIVEEMNYDDNVKEVSLTVEGNFDLEVTNIDYKKYPIGRWAYAVVKVKNNSDKLVKNVPIRISIEGNTKVERRNIGPNSSNTVFYLFKTPSSDKEFKMVGDINYDKEYIEKNYENNKLSVSVNASSDVSLIDFNNNNSTGRITWTEKRTDAGGKVVEKSFWAELNISAETTPSEVPSGTGFGLVIISKVSTNYDKPNLITGGQLGYVEFLGREYGVIGGGIDKDQAFMLKENPDSILYDSIETRHLTRKIYTPVELKDGAYDVKIFVGDVVTPGGMLSKTIEVPIKISKSMYDFDYTKP